MIYEFMDDTMGMGDHLAVHPVVILLRTMVENLLPFTFIARHLPLVPRMGPT